MIEMSADVLFECFEHSHHRLHAMVVRP
jgi:hypothetical protein